MTNEALLCNWFDYEAYTMLTPPKRAPFPYCWALRAQERPSTKRANDQEHAYVICVENPDLVKKWVFAIWNARVRRGPAVRTRVAAPCALLRLRAVPPSSSGVRRGVTTRTKSSCRSTQT